MKKTLLIAVVTATTLALTACAQVSGVILEKEVEVRFTKKKAWTCYEFEIQEADGSINDICVSKNTYDKYNEGDKYP